MKRCLRQAMWTGWLFWLGLTAFPLCGDASGLQGFGSASISASAGAFHAPDAGEARVRMAKIQVPFLPEDDPAQAHGMRYRVSTPRAVVFATDGGITYLMSAKGDNGPKGWVVREKWAMGASRESTSGSSSSRNGKGSPAPASTVFGAEPSPASIHFFQGNDPSRWGRRSAYNEVAWDGLGGGIRVALRMKGADAEKVFVVEPGGHPDEVSVAVEGVDSLSIDEGGNLVMETGVGPLVMSAPEAYQIKEGSRVPVRAAYRIEAAVADSPRYGFTAESYDPALPLIIDPSLLASTFIGGSREDTINEMCVARDGSGSIYVTGHTWSADFPVSAGAYDPSIDDPYYSDVFVSKFDSNLTTLLASTYLGGYRDDDGLAIDVGAQGDVFIGGYTKSPNFPVTSGAYDKVFEGLEGFVARLDGDLSTLKAGTLFGGWGWTHIYAILVGSGGDVFIGGDMAVNGFPWPAGAYDNTWGGGSDGFLGRLDGDLTTLKAGTYLGGSGDDTLVAIAFDSVGDILATGWTRSCDFPVSPTAFDSSCSEPGTRYTDAFVAKLDPNLSTLSASTYLGSTSLPNHMSEEMGTAVLPDSKGNVYVAGSAHGADFPTTLGAFDSTNTGTDAFVSLLSGDLSTLLASTLLGGNGWLDRAEALALDSEGNVIVFGETGAADFPTTLDAYDRTLNDGQYRYDTYDAFLARLTPDLTRLSYATFLGGVASEWGAQALVLDDEDNMIVAGMTRSSDFPVTEGAFDTTSNGEPGGKDGFVTKMAIPENLWVDVWGPRVITPGASGDYVVKYKNGTKSQAQDVVVVVDLPKGMQFASGTKGGTLYLGPGGGHEVYWKLGNLAPQQEGEITLKVSVAWGTPNNDDTTVMARIGARNFPDDLMDVEMYLDYSAPEVLASRALSKDEISATLASNATVRELFEYCTQGLGYDFFDTAAELHVRSAGKEERLTFIVLMPHVKKVVCMLVSGPNGTFVALLDEHVISLFDLQGGMSWNLTEGTLSGWGSWQKTPDGSAGPGLGTHGGIAPAEYDWDMLRCERNCMLHKLADMFFCTFPSGFVNTAWSVKSCAEWVYAGLWDLDSGADCAASLVSPLVQAAYEKIGYSAGWTGFMVGFNFSLYSCIGQCYQDTSSYLCTEDKVECCDGAFGDATGGKYVCVTPCNKATGFYGLFIDRTGHKCLVQDGYTCVPSAACSLNADRCCIKCDEKPWLCKKYKTAIRTARDPNAKSADILDEVIPGKAIRYTVDYENVGAGTAYEVFVLDRLPEGLDENSVVVGDGGKFSKTSGLLSWSIGELEAGQQGKVGFSARVKATMPEGSQIINRAEVHFPSADEVTPTNPVVHTVRPLVANPQNLEVEAGKPLPILLTGQGGGSLQIEVLHRPLYGAIAGTPPKLVYTADMNFSGVDVFDFAVGDGVSQSSPALVSILVTPSPKDTDAPTVRDTYPENGAVGVAVHEEEVSPGAYAPSIEATFSEPMLAETINAESFIVEGVTGTILYDATLRKALFVPSAPLVPNQQYAVLLDTGIQDVAGNPLKEPHAWTFKTGGEATIGVTLPGGLSALSFGRTPVNETREQTVTVFSKGSGALAIGAVGIGGSQPAYFSVTDDRCSGTTLQPQASCTIQVAFTPPFSGDRPKDTVLQAVLNVSSSDPATPTLQVPMQGKGIVGKPDLWGAWKSVSESCNDQGTRCRVRGTVQVENTGRQPAEQSLVRFYLSRDGMWGKKDTLIGEASVEELNPGQSIEVTLDVQRKTSASGRRVIAVMDATKVVKESDERNNRAVSEVIRPPGRLLP